MTTSAAQVSLRGIAKRFGAVAAIDHVDLEIVGGEFFSLLGPSGCGKTTLLRMVGGLEFPTSGRILIDGVDVTRLPPYCRPTNMVFQSYAIFPHLDVGENIGYGLRRLGLPRHERQRKVGRMLELVRLPGLARRRPDQLSGGQLQRVALARALILEPKVLLLDEPLAALDRKLRESMQLELRQLQREVGITFLFVTHDQEEALTLSDRIAIMSAGRVLQCAAPRGLYERPLSREVAAFLGEMNFLEGRVAEIASGAAVVEVAGFAPLALAEWPLGLAAGSTVLVALRPERIAIVRAPAPGSGGVVRSKAYFGNRTGYLVEIPGLAKPISVSCANDALHAFDEVEIGGSLHLALDPAGAILLPAD
jgi:ABC-type Fe3+/spermidine/putrescine transport system ATPase subunit